MKPESPEAAVPGIAAGGNPCATGSRGGAAGVRRITGSMPRCRIPDLTGMTIGNWVVLYETTEEENPHCMCRCVRCGVRRIFPARKIRKGYALRCRECGIREAQRG